MKSSLKDDPRLRFFLGDIRDRERLKFALKGVSTVVHAAALKQVDAGEKDPFEFIKTNIIGSQNLVETAIEQGVNKVIALSTDKASSPVNLYGATKLAADKLFIAANNYVGSASTCFSVVRYGNVFGSRGSLLTILEKAKSQNITPTITHLGMTRFFISINDAIRFVNSCLAEMTGGELFVPKLPSIRIIDLFNAFNFSDSPKISGIRPGEKIHEEMISVNEAPRTIEQSEKYIICPALPSHNFKTPAGSSVDLDFSYNSFENKHFLTSNEIASFINR
jgi:UDP-N-acetylglucosamine 4,6-dehydratase